MRLDRTKREVSSSGTTEVASATIKATAKIFDMFADQTYANKPVAIMRELVANGVDAHIAAGKPEKPVQVTLPTSLDPMCVIKDYGIGMAHDFVMGPFMAYTDGSTKDSSDDQIGGFGIGSKSPFAYVDQFTLRVTHDGTLSVYTMFKGEDGIPMIGLQGQTKTDESNGVEVSFPVEEKDIQTFRDAAQEALQYFTPMPDVIGGELKAPKYTYRGNGWALAEKAAPLGVIMGGVRYPVEPTSLEWELQRDEKLSPLLKYGIDITLPIGAAGVAMSREALSYTKKTSDSIRDALSGILDDVVKTFATFFDDQPTEWDAMVTMYNELGGSQTWNRSARQQLMAKNSRYKGKQLTTEFRLADNDMKGAKVWRIDPKSRRRSDKCPTPQWKDGLTDLYGITPGAIENVIFDDLEVSPKNKNVAKMRAFVDSQPQDGSTLVIRPAEGSGATLADLKILLRGYTKIIATSTLPEPPKRVSVRNAARPKVRMFTYNGASDPSSWSDEIFYNLNPGQNGKKGVVELPDVDQPSKGIMVIMDNFSIPRDIKQRIETRLIHWSDLVFVNTSDAAHLKSTFEDFESVWTKRLDAALSQHPDLPHRLAVANDGDLAFFFKKWREIRDNTKLTAAEQKRPFGRVAAAYEEYIHPLTSEQRRYAPFVKAELPPRFNPEKLREAVEAKQPKLARVLRQLGTSSAVDVDIIRDYL